VGNSDNFDAKRYSQMADKEEDRKKFVASVMEIIDKYNISGFLINWDAPGSVCSVSKENIEYSNAELKILRLRKLQEPRENIYFI